MAANFCEGDLDRPAADEPAQTVERVCIEVGAEKGLRLEFARRVADQDVADGNASAGMVPHGGGGDDLEHPFATAVPSRHQQTPPTCLWIDQALLQCGLTFADNRRAPGLPGMRFGAGLWSAASSRRRVIMVTHDRTLLSRSMAAKLASPTPMMRRCGNQSGAWIRTCLPPVSFLCWRLPD